MTDAKSITPSIPQRFTHTVPATRDKPADTHIMFTTDATATCAVPGCNGADLAVDELPTAEERREAMANAKASAKGARGRGR